MQKFCEKDPDPFFVRITDACNWPDAARDLMLQTVLIGKSTGSIGLFVFNCGG